MDTKSHNTIANTMPSNEDWMDIINGIPNQDTESTTNTSEWRSQIQPETRQRIINFVFNIFIKYAPYAGKRLLELQMLSQRFEENRFTSAISQSDYLQNVSLENFSMSMETKSPNTIGQESDWRAQIPLHERQRVVNYIVDTLKKYLLIHSSERLLQLQNIAQKFESKILSAVRSQTDYLTIISQKMLDIETKYQNSSIAKNVPSYQFSTCNKLPNQASLVGSGIDHAYLHETTSQVFDLAEQLKKFLTI